MFPVSSLGHAVVLPALLHWRSISGRSFLPFLVMLHLGTATALLLYFWRDWWALRLACWACAGPSGRREPARVPADRGRYHSGGDRRLRPGEILPRLFGSPLIAALFLVLNGLLLLFGERIRGMGIGRSPRLTVKDALVIGCWQCAALIPGISRSGATIVGGLTRGIDHEGSAHFSFLIATPIILGATVLEVPKLLHERCRRACSAAAVLAAVVAGVTAWLSTSFLMRYFRRHDDWALNPFAYYCIAAGLGSAIWLLAG